jgi:hypothetical protein
MSRAKKDEKTRALLEALRAGKGKSCKIDVSRPSTIFRTYGVNKVAEAQRKRSQRTLLRALRAGRAKAGK